MNQAQRNYLIKKIQDTADAKRKQLEASIPKMPNLSNYLLHAVLSGTIEIQTTERLHEIIKQKALKAGDGDNWLSDSRRWDSTSSLVSFKLIEFFIIPEEYSALYNEYKDAHDSIRSQIHSLNIQVDTLITRIQLASDKVLQTMINEIDDMGNLSLYDTKLKSIGN